MSESRTNKSVKNIVVSLLSHFAGVALTLYSKKIFLNSLGVDTIGLQSTISGFLGTLSLAELGLGVAIGATLYRHLEDKNQTAIMEIISIQGWFYRWVAVLLVLCSLGFLIFSPGIFQNESLPMWYVYATLGAFLWNAVSGYLFNYKSVILGADQKSYKLAGVSQFVNVAKVLAQVALFEYSDSEYNYAYFLALELSSSIMGILWLEYVIRKEYPWLKPNKDEGWALRKKYPDLLKNTGQIVVHRFSSIALSQVTPLIMFAYTSLTLIGNYTTYGTLTNSAQLLIAASLASIGAGIGSLVAEGNTSKIIGFFWEQIAVRQFMATVAMAGIIIFGHHVISLWVGSQYKVPDIVLTLMAVYFYQHVARTTIDGYIQAYRLFHDIWAPMVEGGICLSLAFVFGYYWGLPGIQVATLISVGVIVHGWKPYMLYRMGFKQSCSEYWRSFVKYPLVAIVSVVSAYWVYKPLALESYSLYELILHSVIFGICFSFFLGGVYYMMSEGFRKATGRILALGFKKFR